MPTSLGASTTGYGNQESPDVVGNLRIDQAWGSAQVMGAVHQVSASDTTTAIGTNGPSTIRVTRSAMRSAPA